jgi:two-component system nitrogen regulation response regulator GlnG/two-component system response regulator HydG
MLPEEESVETGPEPAPARPSDPLCERRLGLVVLWNREQPEHAGAWIHVGAVPSPFRVLGRGSARANDDHPRLLPVRVRPDWAMACAPFQNSSLSRSQLLVRIVEPGVLELRNVGRCRLALNGEECSVARARPGDVLEVGAQLALLCAERTPLSKVPGSTATHAFGAPDACGFVGESPAAWALRAELAFVAPRKGHVILFGATGTGKELATMTLHAGATYGGPLVSRNAATLPETLVDAELFGNLKGYPNAGSPDRKGLIGAADGGTLFLDEFAELSPDAQTHLLRALDSGEYQRLGEATVRRSRFRLVAATNRPESALRTDLLARFDFRIHVPELAERREDLPLIASHLLGVIAKGDPDIEAGYFEDGTPRLSTSLVRRMVMHDFTANVRELRQLLWRAIRESTDGTLDWPAERVGRGDRDTTSSPPESMRVGPAELRAVLDENNGSIEKSWRVLGLSSRYALVRLLRKHGVVVSKKLRSG